MTGRIIGDLKGIVVLLEAAMSGIADGEAKDKVAGAIKSLQDLSMTVFSDKTVIHVDSGAGTAYRFPGIDQPCCVHCFESSWKVVELAPKHWLGKQYRSWCPVCERWACPSSSQKKKSSKKK